MPNAYIAGTGYYFPPRVVKNDDLRTEYGIDTTDEWIRQRSGIEERRFADEGVGTSDIAVPASEMAIEQAGIDKHDVDLIIFCTLSPDQMFPGSGVYLQSKLGLCDGDKARFPGTLDIRNQCSGFLYGLATASSMVQTGMAQNVLLVGAEVHSAALDLTTRGRNVSSLFGDGAGAVIVRPTDEDRGIRGCYLGADGRHADALCMKVWNISHRPYLPLDAEDHGRVSPDVMWPYMEGRVVFKHAVERMLQSMMKAFQEHQLTVNDVDLFLFHQANLRIIQYMADTVGIPPEKVFNNIMRYGNTTAATIPTLMAEAEREGKLERGMKVCAVVFGSGFTWGSAIIDW
jgi:3-oxoacyl-[acyl-carrier-protein] synthase III